MELSKEERRILELYREDPFRLIELYQKITSDPQGEEEPFAFPEKENGTSL